jgi:hypothetical protein
LLADARNLGTDGIDQLLYLGGRDELGVALGELHQGLLALGDHVRQLLDQVRDLPRDHRHDPDQQQHHEGHEGDVDDQDARKPGPAQALKEAYQALQ